MATEISASSQQRRRLLATRLGRSRRPVADRRHPVVAVAMALPCAIALLLLFGGWDQMVTQTQAVANLIGR
ncbi:hypothetical protein P3T36_000631 [Kitasatospora sp. MAP12-15]|uniref:hypothetical protein n=1 Tax=unclassified Kitasatospora TaxID=2633591 RepID=UPI0024772B2E|nr:hypothetical protein [Kitasatospora sp. MAP12-44]MDH6114230.1 hypothetical protein [Kitasatospora sp. MAP12-44]